MSGWQAGHQKQLFLKITYEQIYKKQTKPADKKMLVSSVCAMDADDGICPRAIAGMEYARYPFF